MEEAQTKLEIRSRPADLDKLKALAEQAVDVWDAYSVHSAKAAFIGLCRPHTVLALLAERDALLAAAAPSRELTPTWQPMETAPKDGVSVLLYAPDENLSTLIGWWEIDAWRNDWGYLTPSHWMPLPPAPAPGDERQA